MDAALGQVRLKKTTTAAKPAAVAIVNNSATQDRAAAFISKKFRECDLDTWYEVLREHTYETIFVELTKQDAAAMVSVHEGKAVGAAQAKATVDSIREKLHAAMSSMGGTAFVKLSSRSAKDSPIAAAKTKRVFEEFIAGITDPKPSLNTLMQGLTIAYIQGMKMESATEAMDVLLSSDRVYQDLLMALERPASEWRQSILVRKWVSLPLAHEFRGFIFNNKLTALSQYYCFCTWPELISVQDRVVPLIQAFFETVKDIVPVSDHTYIMDFVLDMAHNRVYIVELNPFGDYEGMGADTALFSLTKDKAILFGQDPALPIQLRVATEIDSKAILDSMSIHLREIFAAQGY
ncbi:cell division cycle protein 123-like [Pelomyxa schiedti]|nr:cell division cycle protein 123-like [Pelomyxa schiedti]